MSISFEDVLKAVEQMTPEEKALLRQALDANDKNALYRSLTPEERARKLEEGAKTFREGLTDEELQELVDAMNEDTFSKSTDERVQENE